MFIRGLPADDVVMSDPAMIPVLHGKPPAARPLLRIALLVLCAAGALMSMVLVRMSLPSEAPLTLLGSPVCTPTDRVNCDYVLASRWSKIGPIPVAALGATYFAGLLSWFGGIGLPNRAGRRWHWLPLLACAMGLLISALYFYLMAVRLPVWCHLCVAVHGVNAAVFLLCLAGYPWRSPRLMAGGTPADGAGNLAQPAAAVFPIPGEQPIQGAAGVHQGLPSHVSPISVAAPPYPSRARAWAVMGLTMAVGWASFMTLFSLQMKTVARRYQLDALAATNNADYIIWRYRETPAQKIPLQPDDQVIGSLQTPYCVVVFSDFECPNCAGFHRYAYRLTQLFPNSVRFVFKHYPLSSACNPHVKQTMQYFSCEAAEALETARRAGTPEQLYRFQQALFENRQRLDERPYEALAIAAGIDRDTWRMAAASEAGRERIAQDAELAHRLGVEGTPAIFINGRRLPAWHILTTDASPVVDLAATDGLWEKLLHTEAN